MLKVILAGINLAIAAVRGAFAIKRVVKEDGTVPQKIAGVSRELSKVTEKLQSLAKETPAEWDDAFAEGLREILDAIAENIVAELEGATE